MNSKEALKRLENYLKDLPYAINYKKEHNLIKQDLDRLEKLEKENRKQLSTILDLDIENRTLKQAFEILKDILKIQIGVRVDERKILIVSIVEVGEWFAIDITKEQYELLKEVLDNE